jgi:HEAT repeat protein
VDRLLEQLRSGTAEKRRDAALNLGLLGMSDRFDSLADVERAVGGLLEALRDPAPEVRARAVWSLDEINPSRSIHCRSRH